MKFATITLDVGDAMNAFKLLWNYPDMYKSIFLHLGDFHFIKENFGVLGKIVSGSESEDVIFQSNVCSNGSFNGVIAGYHYNRGWIVHGLFPEGLERLLIHRFFVETNMKIPDEIKE